MLKFSDFSDETTVESNEFVSYFQKSVVECISTYSMPALCICRNTAQPFARLKEEYRDKLLDIKIFPSLKLKVCVDIGANVGAFSCYAAENFEKVYAFEPAKQNYDFLNKVLEASEISNVETYNLAVASTSGEKIKIFHGPGMGSGAATTIDPGGKKPAGFIRRYESRYTISLEDIYELVDEDFIDYMKIDCEGSEYDFLLGKDISRINYLAIECHGNEEKITKLIRFLEEKFYILADWTAEGEGTSTLRTGLNTMTCVNKRILKDHSGSTLGAPIPGLHNLQWLSKTIVEPTTDSLREIKTGSI